MERWDILRSLTDGGASIEPCRGAKYVIFGSGAKNVERQKKRNMYFGLECVPPPARDKAGTVADHFA